MSELSILGKRLDSVTEMFLSGKFKTSETNQSIIKEYLILTSSLNESLNDIKEDETHLYISVIKRNTTELLVLTFHRILTLMLDENNEEQNQTKDAMAKELNEYFSDYDIHIFPDGQIINLPKNHPDKK